MPTILRGIRAGIARGTFAAVALTMVRFAAAHADNILDRDVRVAISAAPLASALLEFSTQSGLKVAAADSDVARLQASPVKGTYPVHEALTLLLNGTGLSFSPVGAETIAIHGAAMGPAIEPGGSNQEDTDAPLFPDVTTMTPRLATEQELAGDSVRQFIAHHATLHYFNTGVSGNVAHWPGGKQSVCPAAFGLSPAYNGFVTARIRALAAKVGAPLSSDPKCRPNVRIYFSTDPNQLMTNVVKWASVYFRPRGEFATMKPFLQVTGDHAVQGWYLTIPRRAAVLNSDLGLLPLNLHPLWPRVVQKSSTDNGDVGSIGSVVMIIDTAKVVGYAIGTVADYVGVLSLSFVQSPDHCDPLPSILDIMAPSCAAREHPTGVTAGDLAFLKALYYRNTGIGPSPSTDDMQYDMLRQLKRE
ncbi:MAG: hypothetical protein JSR66_19210 [Proteobacteria bacterium]|nr:hypothetical protein [Pseudomonadota bacterium]